jgi:hypothetical protein
MNSQKAVTTPPPQLFLIDVFLSILQLIPHNQYTTTTTINKALSHIPLLHTPNWPIQLESAFGTSAWSLPKVISEIGTSLLKAVQILVTLVTMASEKLRPAVKYFTECLTMMFGLKYPKGVQHQKWPSTRKIVLLFFLLALANLNGMKGQVLKGETVSKGAKAWAVTDRNMATSLTTRGIEAAPTLNETPTKMNTYTSTSTTVTFHDGNKVTLDAAPPVESDPMAALVKELLQEVSRLSAPTTSLSLSRHLRTLVIVISLITLVVGIIYLYREWVCQIAKRCSIVTIMILAAMALIISVIDYIVQTGLTITRQAYVLKPITAILRPALYFNAGLTELTSLISRYFPLFLSFVGISSLALAIGLTYYSRVKDGKSNTGIRRRRPKGISPGIEQSGDSDRILTATSGSSSEDDKMKEQYKAAVHRARLSKRQVHKLRRQMGKERVRVNYAAGKYSSDSDNIALPPVVPYRQEWQHVEREVRIAPG